MPAVRRGPPALHLFASCAVGLEPLLAGELRALGITPDDTVPGGVSFTGGADAVCRANLWLRTASRVIARVATLRARAFGELERRARTIPWDRYLTAGRPVRLRVTSHKSRLYHTAGIAQRLASAIEGALPGARVTTASADDAAPAADAIPDQMLIVRLVHDECTVSVDSSGALLHRRGYRLETAKAPMRETLAAAMILASRWDGRAPLIDPLCGSGTIAIEAALIARGMAPGARRRFAFEHWPDFPMPVWSRALEAARAQARPASSARILASDRDAGAARAARGNAARAGVAAHVEIAQRPVSAITPPPGPGWVITNPPYGVRVVDRRALRDLYAQLGNVLRARCPGWTVALMSPDDSLAAHTGLSLEPVITTTNGGLPVAIRLGTVT